MAKIKKGILGGISGTVGNVVGGNWKGVDYIRSKPSSVSNPRTPAQVEHRAKFKYTVIFMQSIKGLVNIGLRSVSGKMYPANKATSINMSRAITGSNPDFSVDMEKLVFSRGKLLNVLAVQLSSDEAGKVTLDWRDNSVTYGAHASDRLMVMAYDPDTDMVYYLTEGPQRSEETAQLELPASMHGKEVHVSIAFLSENRVDVSDNMYAGSVTVMDQI